MADEKEAIKAAAIKTGNGIVEGKHHGECLKSYVNGGGIQHIMQSQFGFVTTQGRFVDRVEAARIAFESGMTKKPYSEGLISEDIWYYGDYSYEKERGYYLPITSAALLAKGKENQ